MIKISKLSKKYKKEVVFENVDLIIPSCDGLITIYGKSGSGKSTLLNIILGYDQKYDGDVEVFGRNLKKLSKKEYVKYLSEIGVVYQDFKLYNNLTVIENLEYLANEQIINKYLKKFNLEDIKNQKVRTLSGGQKQRVAIIRALIKNSKILILDEPTSNLDNKTYADLLKILNGLKEEVQIIVFTNDVRLEDDTNVVYKIEDNAIKESKSWKLNEIPVESIVEDINKDACKIKFISPFKGALRLIKEQKKNYVSKLIISSVIISIFIMAISLGGEYLNKFKEEYLMGFSDNIVILDIYNRKKPYDSEISYIYHPPGKFAWSESDKKI